MVSDKKKTFSLSAGAVPVCYHRGEWFFLVLRSFSYWDFPKGMVEKGEGPWEGAIREVFEETGIREFSTPSGQSYIETAPYGKGKVARYYLIQLKELAPIRLEANPVTGVVEHHEYRWLNYAEARALLGPRLQTVIDWALKKLAAGSP